MYSAVKPLIPLIRNGYYLTTWARRQAASVHGAIDAWQATMTLQPESVQRESSWVFYRAQAVSLSEKIKDGILNKTGQTTAEILDSAESEIMAISST